MVEQDKEDSFLRQLQAHAFFHGVSTVALAQLLPELKKEKWPRNTCNISGTSLNNFYIIISGRLKIFRINSNNGREFTLFLLSHQDVFDILCLLDACEHQLYYETIDQVTLLTTPIETMRLWVKNNPEINRNLLPYLGRQMRQLEEYATNVTLIDISTRLARLILTHINKGSQKLELINDLSNDEIANLIGSTRAVVNRHLQEFKQDGLLKTGRKKVEIQNLELLLRKAENKHL